VIVGIDPGVSGAIAVISGTDCVGLHDMPTFPKSSGRGLEVACGPLVAILARPRLATAKVYVEKVHSMPGQGVTSMFGFGRSLGAVEGALAALDMMMVLVSPQKWKSMAGLRKKPKDYSRSVAAKLYPGIADQLTRKKDSGKADAILIAHYGRILEGGS